MLSPSPQPPAVAPEPEKKKVGATPLRKRTGQTPFALALKAIFRPIFKGLYYLIQFVRHHALLTLIAIVLLLVSTSLTGYFTTGLWPFGIGHDQFNFHINGTSGGGEQVKNWVYHLREGNSAGMSIDEKSMSQPPTPDTLIGQYSPTKGALVWNSITVMSVTPEQDTSIDSFVEIDVTANGPGGPQKGFLIWHFVTFAQNGGILASVDLVGSQLRPAQSLG